jgi:predicted aminopeptidase
MTKHLTPNGTLIGRAAQDRKFRSYWLPGHIASRALKFIVKVQVISLISGCYVARLGYNQNNLMNSRQLISTILVDPGTSKALQGRLQFVQKILDFADNSGLNSLGAYRYFVQTNQPVVSYLVEAAYANRLESLTWWFPVVGTVPYRGYFDVAERDAIALELSAQGYDVAKSGVGAFSSLGWFDDPLYSAMLQRQDYSLAHLLFHELTHRTYWSPGSVQFNENLAEYVADYLTIEYFTAIKDEKALESYRLQQADLEIYHGWLSKLRADLKAMYDRLAGKDQKIIKSEKAKIFVAYLTEHRPKFARFDFIGTEPWNNAKVLGAGLYSPDLSVFRKAHRCSSVAKIGDFLARLKIFGADSDDQFLALASMCKKK